MNKRSSSKFQFSELDLKLSFAVSHRFKHFIEFGFWLQDNGLFHCCNFETHSLLAPCWPDDKKLYSTLVYTWDKLRQFQKNDRSFTTSYGFSFNWILSLTIYIPYSLFLTYFVTIDCGLCEMFKGLLVCPNLKIPAKITDCKILNSSQVPFLSLQFYSEEEFFFLERLSIFGHADFDMTLR